MKQQIQNKKEKKEMTKLSTNNKLRDRFIKITMCQLSNVFCPFIPAFVQEQWHSLFEKSFQNLFQKKKWWRQHSQNHQMCKWFFVIIFNENADD